jgi:hypothetical protein
MWLYFDPARAKDAWSEALRREPQKNVVYFRRMLADVGNRTGLRVMMRELAGDRTDLLIEWLLTSSPEEFRTELNRLKAVDGYSSWNSNQLASLFSAWLRSGNPAELIQAMEDESRMECRWVEAACGCLCGTEGPSTRLPDGPSLSAGASPS